MGHAIGWLVGLAGCAFIALGLATYRGADQELAAERRAQATVGDLRRRAVLAARGIGASSEAGERFKEQFTNDDAFAVRGWEGRDARSRNTKTEPDVGIETVIITPGEGMRFRGRAEAGQKLLLRAKRRLLGRATAEADGSWSIEVGSVLSAGEHAVSLRVAGDESTPESTSVQLFIPRDFSRQLVVKAQEALAAEVAVELEADRAQRRLAERMASDGTEAFDRWQETQAPAASESDTDISSAEPDLERDASEDADQPAGSMTILPEAEESGGGETDRSTEPNAVIAERSGAQRARPEQRDGKSEAAEVERALRVREVKARRVEETEAEYFSREIEAQQRRTREGELLERERAERQAEETLERSSALDRVPSDSRPEFESGPPEVDYDFETGRVDLSAVEDQSRRGFAIDGGSSEAGLTEAELFAQEQEAQRRRDREEAAFEAEVAERLRETEREEAEQERLDREARITAERDVQRLLSRQRSENEPIYPDDVQDSSSDVVPTPETSSDWQDSAVRSQRPAARARVPPPDRADRIADLPTIRASPVTQPADANEEPASIPPLPTSRPPDATRTVGPPSRLALRRAQAEEIVSGQAVAERDVRNGPIVDRVAQPETAQRVSEPAASRTPPVPAKAAAVREEVAAAAQAAHPTPDASDLKPSAQQNISIERTDERIKSRGQSKAHFANRNGSAPKSAIRITETDATGNPPVIKAKDEVLSWRSEPNRGCQNTAGRALRVLPGLYTVAYGDTLWGISDTHYGQGVRYRRIYRANQNSIRDPHWIYPCQRFRIPEPADR